MTTETSLEKILAYYNLLPFMNNEDWHELGHKLGINQEEAQNRISGKTSEDNFFLIASSYKNVEAVIAFNETLTKITGTPSADGLILFKNGERALVEVKSTKEQEWRISKKRFENQKLLADKLQIKLVYAIYAGHYWGVYSPDYLISNDYKIKHMKDLKSSLFDTMFEAKLIKIPRGLQIIKQFSTAKGASSPVGIYSQTYGHVVRYLIRYGNLLHKLNDTYTARAFAAIELAISDNTRIYKRSEIQTDIVIECPMDSYINDCRLSIEHIQITINNKNEQRFNASSFLTHAVGSVSQVGSIDFSKGVELGLLLIDDLIKAGFPFEIVKASETDYIHVNP